MTLNTRRPARIWSQSGTALITSLLMLMVLTIIGVTVMQMSRMQERMTGNTRDINLAFQGAEGALREGEAFVDSHIDRPIGCSVEPCGTSVWLSGEAGGNGRVEHRDNDWWVQNATPSDELGVDLKDDPMYIVEEEGALPIGGEIDEVYLDYYRISGRSTGGSGNAEAIVQTTFSHRFP